nr:LysM peptidoglycan-binding domain-containing protein [Sedimentibacter sp.]
MQRYNIKPYDTLISVAHKFGIPYAQLLASYPRTNNAEHIHARYGANRSTHSYIVANGDTLNKISQRFNVPLDLIISSNPRIMHDKYIVIGQQISIPDLEEPPTQLREIGIAAENIMAAIDMQDWDTVNLELETMRNYFDELEPILVDNSISPSLIYKLETTITDLGEAIASENAYESKSFANDITLLISYILDYYSTEIPTDIDKLDFLGREIILNVEEEDWDSALDNIDFVNVIWRNLEPQLSNFSAQDITEFSQIVDSLGQSINNRDPDQTIVHANEIINKIFQFEQNF